MDPANRFGAMPHRPCGESGLLLPEISLGFGHGFGKSADPDLARGLVVAAFERGVTAFDLSSIDGPPAGSAEKNFGKVFKKQLKSHRDELTVASKAGAETWPGPYGRGGSRKHIFASLERSLKRLGLSYLDIFYHQGADAETPAEETAEALAHAVQAGKALYIGLCNYPAARMETMVALLRELRVPVVVHQNRYSLFQRELEDAILGADAEAGLGTIVSSPLCRGMLSDSFLAEDEAPFEVTENRRIQLLALRTVAERRGQSLSAMALNWVMRHPTVCSTVVGVSREDQLKQDLEAIENPVEFSDDDLAEIERILASRFEEVESVAEAAEFTSG